jgi:23S rRNA (pseudouridine1915-N3)-methyltransferase
VRIHLAVVGRPRDAALATAIREYEARAARYWPLVVHEAKEEPSRATSAALVKQREGERLLARLPPDVRFAACAIDGDRMASEDFARWLSDARDRAQDVGFVIGGAFGLSDAVLARSARKLSLAPWTLPHELARLVLAEQLYRAGTIVRGEPYHK